MFTDVNKPEVYPKDEIDGAFKFSIFTASDDDDSSEEEDDLGDPDLDEDEPIPGEDDFDKDNDEDDSSNGDDAFDEDIEEDDGDELAEPEYYGDADDDTIVEPDYKESDNPVKEAPSRRDSGSPF